MNCSYSFLPATIEPHLSHIRTLFLEYANSLGLDLSFQDFDTELANLPGDYSPPEGRLYLIEYNGETAGCVALRKFSDGVGEMKRMFIRWQFRGKGLGRASALKIIEEAKKIGYKKLRLDTLPQMTSAIVLYLSLDFKEIPPYRFNPIKGAKFFELAIPS